MANVTECIEKLVAAGQVSRAIADEALETFKRSKAEYLSIRGPAISDAAAAQYAAAKMSAKAIEKQTQVAAGIKTWRALETHLEAVGNPNEGVASTLTKTARGGAHPFQNIDYLGKTIEDNMHRTLGRDFEKFKTGFITDAQKITSSKNFVHEMF